MLAGDGRAETPQRPQTVQGISQAEGSAWITKPADMGSDSDPAPWSGQWSAEIVPPAVSPCIMPAPAIGASDKVAMIIRFSKWCRARDTGRPRSGMFGTSLAPALRLHMRQIKPREKPQKTYNTGASR
jgi:hypothetical protein